MSRKTFKRSDGVELQASWYVKTAAGDKTQVIDPKTITLSNFNGPIDQDEIENVLERLTGETIEGTDIDRVNNSIKIKFEAPHGKCH